MSIVEVHSVQRVGLKALLESDSSITVLGAWSSSQQADLQITDVLILSYCAVCDLPPTDLVSSLARDHRVVLYSGKETSISLMAYHDTGAHALLHQSDSDEKILSSIRLVATGKLEAELPAVKSAPGLSQRETLVLALVGDGYTRDQIARRIGISKHTVDTYLRRIRSKLSLGNKAELARAAMHLAGSWANGRNLPTTEQSA